MGILEYINLKKIERKSEKVLEKYKEIQKLTDEEIRNKTLELKKKVKKGEDVLIDAYALVMEASYRTIGLLPFKVQVMGAIVLNSGHIAEMKTGEGKTLVATLPAYLNALTERGVYVVTVNDYLAKRDREEMGKIYEFLGLSVGLIQHDMSTEERKEEYKKDIVYVTNSELGFDYLKDNLARHLDDRVLSKDFYYCIVDEADSILIDEARTPLIIGKEEKANAELYHRYKCFVENLYSIEHQEHYTEDDYKCYDVIIYPKERNCVLTEIGLKKAEKFFNKDLTLVENHNILFSIKQTLYAHFLLKKDVDYTVINNKIEIIDEYTGRILSGRKYSQGLHQAVECKENLPISDETKVLASITYQMFFNLFEKLSGMTGTAKTAEEEFEEIYNMNVVCIPTNKPVIRIDHDDKIFISKKVMYEEIVKDVINEHKKGRPVLIGTRNVKVSEELSDMLKKASVKHNLLNAKNHEKEAEIVKNAGLFGAVTISTNMAGRGTDIKLEEKTKKLGGLKVIGVERNENKRIDDQLIGRAGRQGDVGESVFYLSLEDELFLYYNINKLKPILSLYPKDKPISHKTLTKAIEDAQKTISSLYYTTRKYSFKLDKILQKQREIIYSNRKKLLEDEIEESLEKIVRNYNGKEKEYSINTQYDFLAKHIALSIVDEHWSNYLTEMEDLKKEIGLMAYKGVDVITEFEIESSKAFNRMIYLIQKDIVNALCEMKLDSAFHIIDKVNKILLD